MRVDMTRVKLAQREGRTIRGQRELRGMTQAELARRLRVAVSTVSAAEHGQVSAEMSSRILGFLARMRPKARIVGRPRVWMIPR